MRLLLAVSVFCSFLLALIGTPREAIADDAGTPACADHATMEMAYEMLTTNDVVRRLAGPDGSVTEYRSRAVGTQRYEITCRVTDARHRADSAARYVVSFLAPAEAGSGPKLARLDSFVDGDATSTTYDSNGHRITSTQNGETERFAYDDAGRIVFHETPEQAVRYTYLGAFGDKVTSVDLSGGAGHFRATYAYDANGDLVHMVASDGNDLRLDYDESRTHIVRITGRGLSIAFSYTRDGQMSQIAIPNVGTIDVTYDASGKQHVEAGPSGEAVAVKAQALMEVLEKDTQPANVEIRF